MQQGFGKYTCPNGDYYEGQWYQDMKNGKGTGCEAGTAYSGDWYEDKAHGMGALTMANGNVFRGKFNQGEYVEDDSDDSETPRSP